MSSLYERLAEGLPDRHPPGRNSFQTEPKALKAWLDALPMANPSAAARLLFNALREVNQLRVDALARLYAMECLRAPVMQIAEAVDRQILGSSFPLPPQKQQLGTIAQDFQRELAIGYRMSAYELCAPDGRVPFLRGKAVSTALARAMCHTAAQLAKAYLVYMTAPPGTWLTLHTLFRFAQILKLDDKPIDDPTLGVSFSARTLYQHALLLAICNPYRLTQKEVADANAVTRIWAPEATLRLGGGGASFSIPLDEDRGPGYLPEERQALGDALLSFETGPLERYLERELAGAMGAGSLLTFKHESGPAQHVASDFVRRLVASWQPAADRAHKRLAAGHELETLVGLHAIHYFLAGQSDFETFMRRARGPGIALNDRDRGATWTNSGMDLAPERVRARVLDQSLGGYRLLWDKSLSVRARVGEVIGVAMPTESSADEQDWMVGVIRWMRISPDGAVDAGVELLTRRARAAALRTLDTEGRPKPPVRAIELRSLGDGHIRGTSMLAPNVVERGAPQFEVTLGTPRDALESEPDVTTYDRLDVIEQPGTYLLLAPPTAVLDADAPREMFEVLESGAPGVSEMRAQ